MAKIQATECDKCKDRKGPHVSISHAVECFTDAAGSTDYTHASADLCCNCASSRLPIALEMMSEEQRIAFYKRLLGEVRDHRGRPM
jgi:hypothetical protein